ncbi:FUSC family protein [Rhodococcus sp. ARC_M6]|uniref:FUSC family protein n=1 Tax=Rhodococcus sp. ARC_M6 TaxID=2928852 RepID=UPI001FB43A9C|nr:FUSC family protein [Rhodococcus sp. ARC_M6]MCJ0902602.1 FUSC family protein [Rhodococcus sp. ARC_M6]
MKGTVAVAIAWVIADRVFHSPEAFLAPYAALFIIGNTVRNSMQVAARQVSVVVLGVIVAAIAAVILPPVAALALATAAGLLVGRIPLLSPDGVWVAVTAVLVLLYGTATNANLVMHRIGDVILGVAIGIAINAVLVPPDHLSHARDVLVMRTHEVSDVLGHLAEGVRSGGGNRDNWRQRALSVNRSVAAETVVLQGEDSLVGNFRKRSWLRIGGPELFRPVAEAVDRAMLHLMGMVLAVEACILDEDVTSKDPLARLLEAMADAFGDAGRGPVGNPNGDTVVTALPQVKERLLEFEELLECEKITSVATSSIILSSRGLLAELSALGRKGQKSDGMDD